jgi:hypothetical protein
MPSQQLVLAAAVSLVFGSAILSELGRPSTVHAGPSVGRTSITTTAPPVAPIAAEAVERASALALTDAALQRLGKHTKTQSHPDALRMAFQAYYNYKTAHPGQVRKPYLYFVDYGLGNRTPRGYVFDMDALKLVDGPFTVAHGRGSSASRDGVPTKFSNTKDSATSSLGLYLAQETYAFSGKSGGQRYRSLGLRLRGLSGRFNSAARTRGIVVHGAPYVTPLQAGRSEGCPAMEESRAQKLLPKISNGGLVFLFSPRDRRWMDQDPWIRGTEARMATASR